MEGGGGGGGGGEKEEGGFGENGGINSQAIGRVALL